MSTQKGANLDELAQLGLVDDTVRVGVVLLELLLRGFDLLQRKTCASPAINFCFRCTKISKK
jgi:hypothetical protein